MKKSFLLSLFIFSLSTSCNKEEVKSESVLLIKGITSVDELGYTISIDENDWRLNDKFTEKEKQLFDTLNFSKTAIAEPMPISENTSYKTPVILFFPNPFRSQGGLFYYHDKHILNLIVVDSKYTKLYSFRVRASHYFALNLNKLDKGIYRIYYVIQDSQYNIVHLGHGDIENE